MAERALYSFLDSFIGGVNSDLPPILLPKDTLSWTTNCTLRGGYPKPRPPRFLRELTFPSNDVETLFTSTGFFQGAGYYRPDFGAQQLIVAISGRLFSVTEVSGNWTVAEITVPGDPNFSTTNQVWMNQAEKWMIISDGSAQLPIFYDGVSSRRSYGESTVLATTTAVGNFPNPRVIGEVVTVTLTAPYTGPYDVPVIFNGAFYQTVGSGSGGGYTAILTNVSATQGNVISSGSAIEINSSYLGYTTVNVVIGIGTVPDAMQAVLHFSGSVAVSPGNTLRLSGFTETWTVFSVTGSQVVAYIPFNPARLGQSVPAGTLVELIGGGTNFLVAYTTADANIPAQGATVPVSIDRPYTGADGQTVWIGNDEYTISAGGSSSTGNTLDLINISDTADAGAAIPAEDILSVPELSAGRMGAYGLGHQAWCLVDGLGFIYGDTVGGPSGTPANNYRDAVLKTTENTFLAGGGTFRVPSSGEIITAMRFTAVLDASYGQGPLEIATPSRIFTCAVPTDRSTWIALENPILTVALIGDGPLAQESTILANSDTLFRNIAGYGSLIFGRRNFETWGNTPISTEVNRIVESDDRALLGYSSSVTFDNRMLATATPASSNFGVAHSDILALNFDPVSSLRGKAPSIWESQWDGLETLRIVTGIFNGVERCFLFVKDSTDGIQLVEQLRSDSSEFYDDGTDRISWTVETPCIFKPDERDKAIPIVKLMNGKIHVDSIRGEVSIQVQFRPDFYSGWTNWITLNISDSSEPGYLSPIGLGQPPDTACDAPNNRPLRSGRFFQIKFTVIGQCRIMGQEYSAVIDPNVVFPSPECGTISS